MKISQCNHFRIRDTNEYDMDVERFIKCLEKQYKIDFRSITHWKEIVKALHAATTECKRKIQASKQRKVCIIEKIYTQSTRPSPFQLSEVLARTAKKWKSLELKRKTKNISTDAKPENMENNVAEYDEISGELSERKFTAHPNTEIVTSEDLITQPLKSDVETETNLETSHLPTVICINQHKLISPLRSKDSYLSYNSRIGEVIASPTDELREWLVLQTETNVKCIPNEIIVTNPTLEEQSLKFSVINCTTKYINFRFKTITEKTPFRRVKLLPVTPMRLYPGIAVTFIMVFKLSQTDDFPPNSLYFRTGSNVLFQEPTKALLVPILSKFREPPNIFVPEKVNIAPAYSWHVNKKVGFPTEWIKISNSDKCSYHLRIIKRLYDFGKESVDSLLSVNVISPNTESMMERDDIEVETQSKLFSPFKGEVGTVTEVESVKTIDIVGLVVDEIVELALETFVFEHTCLELHPHSKRYTPVYFTKVEHTGFHQRYYDFEFCDPETDDVIVTKTAQIYAEVLPHPVKVYPNILDMTATPYLHGYCEDAFTVTNTHKVYSVTVKVKLTTKMKKLFRINPMEATISASSKVRFIVRMCSKSLASQTKTDEFAHFTVKIIFSGHKPVYYNVPPFFYEIIAPCAQEFKKIYNEKFYSEVPEGCFQEFSRSKITI